MINKREIDLKELNQNKCGLVPHAFINHRASKSKILVALFLFVFICPVFADDFCEYETGHHFIEMKEDVFGSLVLYAINRDSMGYWPYRVTIMNEQGVFEKTFSIFSDYRFCNEDLKDE